MGRILTVVFSGHSVCLGAFFSALIMSQDANVSLEVHSTLSVYYLWKLPEEVCGSTFTFGM